MDDPPPTGGSRRRGTHRPPPSETTEQQRLVRVCSTTDPALVEAASNLLHRQWPRGGTPEQYRRRCFATSHDDGGSEDEPRRQLLLLLPCSYLLVDASSTQLLAHGRLTECYDDFGGGGDGAGRAAAATYVVVQPSMRGKGLGRRLMHLLEKEAVSLGYQYLYLWTHTAIGFYEALGYATCHRVSLHRDCLKSLAPEQVSGLESVLSKRFGATNSQLTKGEGGGAASDRRSETILLPPEDRDSSNQDVWMRKRLVEALDPVAVSAESRVEELRQYVQEQFEANGVPLAWEYFLVRLAHHPQVGPSCGLAAIRMVRDRYTISFEDVDSASLLQLAQRLGMTFDGELFDADDLASLTQSSCQLEHVRVQPFPSVDEITSILVERDGLVILPYDSHPGTRLPFHNSGRSAHWGVVVGMLFGSSKQGEGEHFDGQPDLTPLSGNGVDASSVGAKPILLV